MSRPHHLKFKILFGAVIICAVFAFLLVLKPKVDEDRVFIPQDVHSSRIIAGQPVKWVALTRLKDVNQNQRFLKLPKDAENVILKIVSTSEKDFDLARLDSGGLVREQRLTLVNKSNIFTAAFLPSAGNLILDMFYKLKDAFNLRLLDTKGNKFYDISNVDKDSDFLEIQYQTSAPELAERNLPRGKEIKINAPSELEYINVLAYAKIPEFYKNNEKDKIKINWKNNSNKSIDFAVEDLDNNGYIDYVEWMVPHLSEQTFDIILISKAFELDERLNLLSDIYERVKEKDNVWTTVAAGNSIRVTFSKILDSTRDITIHAKPVDKNNAPVIQVNPIYTDADGNEMEGYMIAVFPEITSEKTYKILLTNLQTPTDTFDLKIMNGDIIFDWIVDPTNYGSEYSYGDATASGTIIKLDSTHFIVAYADANESRYGKAKVGTVSGSEISFGSAYTFVSASQGSVESLGGAALDSTHFVIAYQGAAKVGTVSGSEISFGSAYANNSMDVNVAVTLDSTHFLQMYRDEYDQSIAVIGTVFGTSISYGSEAYVPSYACTTSWCTLSIALLDSTHFVASYDNALEPAFSVGTISGSSISFGSEYKGVATSTSEEHWVVALDSTHFVVAYVDDNTNEYFGKARIGTVSGSEISFGSAYTFDASDLSSGISVDAFDSTSFIIAWATAIGTGDQGYTTVGTVFGTSISFGSTDVYSSVQLAGIQRVAVLDSTHNAVVYRRISDNAGKAVIGTTVTLPPNLKMTGGSLKVSGSGSIKLGGN